MARGSEGLFNQALEALLERGDIEREEYKAGHNGKNITRVRLNPERVK